jgi:solute carrier family 25 (mitochondrial S-adenosylmethionine transporter), member 26
VASIAGQMGRAKRLGLKPVGRYSRVPRRRPRLLLLLPLHSQARNNNYHHDPHPARPGAFTYAALLPIDAVKTRLQARSASTAVSPPLSSAPPSTSAPASSPSRSSARTSRPSSCPRSPAPAATSHPPPSWSPRSSSPSAAKGRSWQVLLQILKTDGLIGLYAGYAATLLRNLPAGVLSYSSFEYLKAFTLNKRNKESLTPGESVLCGALAGAISAALTTPLDVVKTRLMTRVGTQGSRTALGTVSLMGLSRGIGPRVLHSTCFVALGYCAFETARLAILQWYIEACTAAAAA